MEQYEGVAILATNLRQNLDEAFVRRLAFTVHFPFSGVADRRRIWVRIWPDATSMSSFLRASSGFSVGTSKTSLWPRHFLLP